MGDRCNHRWSWSQEKHVRAACFAPLNFCGVPHAHATRDAGSLKAHRSSHDTRPDTGHLHPSQAHSFAQQHRQQLKPEATDLSWQGEAFYFSGRRGPIVRCARPRDAAPQTYLQRRPRSAYADDPLRSKSVFPLDFDVRTEPQTLDPALWPSRRP